MSADVTKPQFGASTHRTPQLPFLFDGQRRLLKKPPNPRAWRRRRLRALRKKSPQSRQMRLKIRNPQIRYH
eukprot:scaffold20643_cov85-Skeletonema_marinoi.AAC.1